MHLRTGNAGTGAGCKPLLPGALTGGGFRRQIARQAARGDGMKVVLDTHDRLVLRDLNLGAGLLLLLPAALPAFMAWGYFRAGVLSGGIILSVIALILIVGCFGAFVRPITVTLDRPGDRIEIVERSMFGTRREVHVLRQIRGATSQVHVIRRKPGDSSGKRGRLRPEPRTWRAALVHQNGHQIPVTTVYGSQTAAQTAAAAINGWIGSDLVAGA